MEKGSVVDVMGKLLSVSDVNLVTGTAGRQEEVCNASIMFTDKLAVPIGFWGWHAKRAQELCGKVVVCFNAFVSVGQEGKKSVNLRAKGSGRIELASAPIKALCTPLEESDKVDDAIPFFNRAVKPINIEGPGFRSSVEFLVNLSEAEKKRLISEVGPEYTEEVTWEIKGVTIEIENNKVFNNEGEVWIRLLVKDHTNTREMSATEDVVQYLTGLNTPEEVAEHARRRSLVPFRQLK